MNIEELKEKTFISVAYSTSKSGIMNLTRYLAVYWAKYNVRVNTLTIAGVFNDQDDEFLSYTSQIPVGKMANENEYDGSVLFLNSEASSYMTGSNLIIDGGWIYMNNENISYIKNWINGKLDDHDISNWLDKDYLILARLYAK